MSPLTTIGCIALALSAVAAIAAIARGEWDIKSRNNAINQKPDLDHATPPESAR